MSDYPSDEELKRIAEWPYTDPRGWFGYISEILPFYGRCTQKEADGRVQFEIATGGWSGCEEIIAAMRENMIWVMTWRSSHRGGLNIFELLREEPK